MKQILCVLCWLIFLPSVVLSQSNPPIPEPLKPWVDWVRQRDPDFACAHLGDAKVCDWPARLVLDINSQGGTFEYDVSTDKHLEVPLPGGDKVQPSSISVTSGGKPVFAPPYRSEEMPWITLTPGNFSVRGSFRWEETPESLRIPDNVAIIDLSVDGKKVPAPKLTDEGTLWLQESSPDTDTNPSADSARIFVYRVLSDGNPLKLQSNIRLTISGKSREMTFPKILPAGFTPYDLRSDLPVRWGAGNTLIFQARPGTFSVQVTASAMPTLAEITPPAVTAPGWPEHEVWVWMPNDSLRAVDIEGGTRVDSSLTELPPEEQGKATYLVTPDETLKIQSTRRGEEEPAQNSLSLTRTMWLDLNGKGFSVQDSISGTMYRDWRLDALPEFEIGRVADRGDPLLITSVGEEKVQGVELRGQNPSLVADARIADASAKLSATGWNHTFDSLAMTVNLPPGWSLFEAYGVDFASNSWFGSWTLLDIWLVIFLVIAIGRLFGMAGAGIALVALILGHHTPGALRQCWFHLVASGILLRYLPDNDLRKFARFYLGVTAFAVIILAVALAVFEIRDGLFPSVGRVGFDQASILAPIHFLLEETVLGWTVLMISLWAVVMIFQLKIVKGIALLAFGLVMLGIFGSFAERSYTPETYIASDMAGTAEMDSSQYLEQPLSKSVDILSRQRSASGSAPASAPAAQNMNRLNQVDPNAVVQTGKGIPNWRFRQYSLGFQGKVSPDQQVNLVLLSPLVNGFLNFVRALAFLLLTWIFLRFARAEWSKGVVTALIAFVLFMGARSEVVEAQSLPSPEILKELETRLKEHECTANCSGIGKATFTVSGSKVVLELAATSDGNSGVPLPGPVAQLFWREVFVDGARSDALRRDGEGFTWVRLTNGAHTVRAEGSLLSRDAVTVQWPLDPAHLSVAAPGYEVDGVDEYGTIEGSIQLVPVAGAAKQDFEQGENVDLPSWFLVRRQLTLGLPWQITTEVIRLGSQDRPGRVKVPLLQGESVTQQDLTVENGVAHVVFARGTGNVTWTSDLAQASELTLKAPSGSGVSESWTLVCSTMWRCAPNGLKPTASVLGSEQGWTWEPYPEETVSLAVTRPTGVPGKSVTIDSGVYHITPGIRISDARLELRVRSSQGASLSVKLPDTATLSRVTNGGTDETSRYSGQRLQLPLKPGANNFIVTFQFPTEMGFKWSVPQIELGEASSNLTIELAAPSNRWILGAGGGQWGPTVLFWSKLVVVILMAVLLGMSRLTPLTTGSWILFGLGLATLPYEMMMVVPIWFLALQYRRNYPFPGHWRFNLFQIALILLTVATIAVIYRAIEVGLILSPNMAITGNGSSNGLLRWYFDFVSGIFPTPWIMSFPMWMWRVVMLLWSVWLVFGLMRWLWWAFESLNDGGIWKGREPKPAQ